jgi:hypothetical protein
MNRAGVRVLTSLAVIAVSMLALFQGWDIVRFSIASASLGPDAGGAETLRPWAADPGLAFSAQESLLTGQPDAGDVIGAQKRRDELAKLLAVRPLSSEYWLALAEMRLAADQSANKVAEAFELSVVTGADEDYVMSRRALFGLSNWEVLPAEVRKRAAADMVTARISDRKRDIIRMALSKKTEEVRRDIRAALQTEGVSQARLVAIGL